MVNENLQHALQQLGLTYNEARCYLAALEAGSVTVPTLARLVDLDRSNAYRTVEMLIKKRLMMHSTDRYAKKVHAEAPQKLMDMAARMRRQARKYEMTLSEMLPLLMSVYEPNQSFPRVQCIEGAESIAHMFESGLEDEDIKEILCCTSADFSLIPDHDEHDREYIHRRKKRKIPIKVLTCLNDRSREWRLKDANELRETRFVPPQHTFPSTMFIYGNKISIITHVEEQAAIIIHSKELYHMHRALFNFMWENANLIDPTTL